MSYNKDGKNKNTDMERFKGERQARRTSAPLVDGAPKSEERTEDRTRDDDSDSRGRSRRDSRDRPDNSAFARFGKMTSPVSALSGRMLEKVSKPLKELMEIYKPQFADTYKMRVDILPASRQDTRVKIDSLIFMSTAIDRANAKTFVYTMMLQEGNNFGQQTTDGDRGRHNTLTYSAVAADAYTEAFKENVEAIILRRHGNKDIGDIVHIGVTAVSTRFDLSKEENVNTVLIEGLNVLYYQHNDFYNNYGQLALVDLLPGDSHDDDDEDERDVRRRNKSRRNRRRRDDLSITSTVIMKPEIEDDIFGLPHSHDIKVEVSLTRDSRDSRREGSRNVMSLEDNLHLATLGANVDVVYLGDEDDRGRSRDRRNVFSARRRDSRDRSVAEPLYGIALNLNAIQAGSANVMGMQLTALANTTLLMDEELLFSALLPAPDEVRLKDPRAFACEQDSDFPADEISQHPSDESWNYLMEALVHPERIFVFLHVPTSGLYNQLLSALVDAVNPDSETRDASYEIVRQACDALTDGRYTENGGDTLDYGELEFRQSLGGWWLDQDGSIRDLSSIGRFNLMTAFGVEHPEYLERWDNTLEDDINTDVAVARQEELIGTYTGKGYTVQHRCDVVRINPEWLEVLADSIRDSGVTIEADGLQREQGRRRSMSTAYSSGNSRSNLYREKRSGRRDWR